MKEIIKAFKDLIDHHAEDHIKTLIYDPKTLNVNRLTHPSNGDKLKLHLKNSLNQDNFELNISTHSIRIEKTNYHLQENRILPLLRLEVFATPHKNPNGEKISENHLHIYKEGFEDRWAYPVDHILKHSRDRIIIFQSLLDTINLQSKLTVDKDIFEIAEE
jgi:hypothetical protein